MSHSTAAELESGATESEAGGEATAVPSPAPQGDSAILHIPLSSLEPDRDQGRRHFDPEKLEELAASIRSFGVIEPILIMPLEGQPARFRIVAGERRWRASALAERPTIPCLLAVPAAASFAQLIENLQRENLNAVESGLQIKTTMARTGADLRTVASAAGIPLRTAQRFVQFAESPEILREAMTRGLLVARKGEEKRTARMLDVRSASEALSIYTRVLEPQDPSPKKRNALVRLGALIRKALSHEWTSAKWAEVGAALAAGSTGRRTTTDGSPEGASPATASAPNESPVSGAGDSDHRNGAAGGETEASLPHPPLSALLCTLSAALACASDEDARAAAEELGALTGAALRLTPDTLFIARGSLLVVFMDRLQDNGQAPALLAHRRELVAHAEAIISATRHRR